MSDQNSKSNPFKSTFLGSGKLVEIAPGKTVMEIALNGQQFFNLMEDPDLYRMIEEGASFQSGSDVYVKLKLIQLNDPKPWKTHFLTVDYYKK